jgi:hypothetical protein
MKPREIVVECMDAEDAVEVAMCRRDPSTMYHRVRESETIINHVVADCQTCQSQGEGVTVCRIREVVIRGNTNVKLRIEGESMPGMYRVCHHAVPS